MVQAARSDTRSAIGRRATIFFAALWLAVQGLVSGCASQGIPHDELPEQPIAVTYWDAEETRRRTEQTQARPEIPQEARGGVAQMDDLAGLVGAGGQNGAEPIPGRLALVYPRTGEVVAIEAAPAGARALGWSEDRRYLIFGSSHLTRNVQLYEWDRESGEVRTLTRGHDDHIAASYGPERRLVFATLDRSGQAPRIFRTDGPTALPREVRGDVLADRLAWSPDGATIVFARPVLAPGRTRQLSSELVLLASDDGGEDRRLAPGRDPVFTPDGGWVVYSAPVRGDWKLRRVRPDGTGRAPLGQSARSERWPAVSPDGAVVAYVAQDREAPRLFVRRFDGTGDRLLLQNGSVEAPVW